MKNLMNLNGAQELSKSEQKNINGGGLDCNTMCPWKPGLGCWWCYD